MSPFVLWNRQHVRLLEFCIESDREAKNSGESYCAANVACSGVH